MATHSRSLRLVLRTRRRSLLLEALEPRQLLANMAPSGTDTAVTLPQNGTYVVQASDFGFTDPHDTPPNNFLAVKIDTLPTLGSLTDNQVPVAAGQAIPVADLMAGKLKFVPAADGWGTPYAAIRFQVQDDGGTAGGGVDIDQSLNTLTFNVVLVNIPPLAPAADTFAVAAGGTLSGEVLRNDFDPQGRPLTAALATDAGHGALTLNANGSFSYTPASGFTGTDTFTYKASNGQTTSDPATVTINVATPGVNSAPAADSDLFYGLQGSSVSPPLSVLANDSDAEQDTLSAALVEIPLHGSVTLYPNGTFQYVPFPSYAGLDHFAYRASDGSLTGNLATVSIDLFAVGPPPAINHAPSGTNGNVSIQAGSGYTLSAADWGFSDPADTPANTFLAVEITTLPTAGSLQLANALVTAGQVISISSINAGLLRFVAGADATGTPYASFTFQVQDNGGTNNGGVDLDPTPNTIAFNVISPPTVNHPPSGTDNTATLQAGSSYTLMATNWGFTDPSDNPQNSFKAVRIVTLPVHGSLTDNGVLVVSGQVVSVVDIVQGRLKFTPDGVGTGSPYASFAFQVQDDGGTANGGVDLDQSPNTLTFNVVLTNAPPITPTADTFAVAAGATLSGEVLRNDFDPQGLPLTAFWDSDVSHGTLMLNANGTFTYAPAAGFTGADTFTYRATNGQTASGPATVTINVTTPGANSAPATDADQYYALQGRSINVTTGVLANDTDAEHDPLTAVLVDNAQHGTVTLNLDGSFIYTPVAGFSGIDHFTYRASDGQLLGNVATASIAVLAIGNPAVNHAPSGTDETVSIQPGQSYALHLDDFGFSDPGDTPPNLPRAVKITTLPAAGSLQLGDSPVTAGQVISTSSISFSLLRFVSATNATGTPYASFTFQVQDNGGTANGGVDLDPTPNTIAFNIVGPPINHSPSGTDKTVTVQAGSSYTLQAADWGFTDPGDATPNALTAIWISSLPTAGRLLLDHAEVVGGQKIPISSIVAGDLQFIPATNGAGTPYASFNFQVQDDGGTSGGGIDIDQTPNTLTFNVLVNNPNPPPILPTADTFAVAAGGSLAGEVLWNDYDPQGLPLTAGAGSDASHGVLVLYANGTFTYTPAPDFTGTDSFTYRASNGQTTSDPATVTINVAPPGANSAPATDADQYYALQGVAMNVAPGVLANDTDAEHDTLTAVLVDNAQHGTVTLNADGSFHYVPVASFSGVDHFTYRASDGQLLGNVATASIVVFAFGNPVVNHAPSGMNSAVTMLEDTAYTVSLADFGFTDLDDTPSNNMLAVRIAALPVAGSLRVEGVPVAIGQSISAAAIAQDKLQFVPAANGNGAPYAGLAFQVQDDGGTAAGGVDLDATPNTLTFNVLAVNDPPSFVKGDDQTSTDESGGVTVPGWATHISAGSDDEAGQMLSFIATTDHPELFVVPPAVDPATGNLTFTPQPNTTGTATIVIALIDNGGTAIGGVDASQPQSLSITIEKPHELHNTEKPMDVNGDGHVVAGDALDIINYINAFGSGPAASRQSAAADSGDTLYYDVNGDSFISPIDALMIINQINAFGSGEGESAATGAAASNWNDTETLIALDVISQYKSRLGRP